MDVATNRSISYYLLQSSSNGKTAADAYSTNHPNNITCYIVQPTNWDTKLNNSRKDTTPEQHITSPAPRTFSTFSNPLLPLAYLPTTPSSTVRSARASPRASLSVPPSHRCNVASRRVSCRTSGWCAMGLIGALRAEGVCWVKVTRCITSFGGWVRWGCVRGERCDRVVLTVLRCAVPCRAVLC